MKRRTASALSQLRPLAPYLRRHQGAIAAGLGMVVVANVLGMAGPYFVKQAVDALGRPGATAMDIRLPALWLVLTAVVGGAARYGMRQTLNGVSRRVELELRDDLFAHLLRLDARFYASTRTGDVMSRATNDLQAVRMVAGPAYMYLANTVVTCAVALGLLFWISPRLTLFSLVPLALLPPVTIGFGRVIHQRFEEVQEHFGTLSTAAQENLAGARIVKAYGAEDAQTARFQTLSDEYLRRNMGLARTSGLFHPLLGYLSGLGLVVVLGLGGGALLRGEITPGDFVAFTLYLGTLGWPLIALGWVVNLFQRGAASMGRINTILHTDPTIRDPADPVALGVVRGEVEFRGVWFRYPGTERWALQDVSFRVPAGATAALVGATGSGKSTIVALLARLWDPERGEILLDGVPITRLRIGDLRAALGVVAQDTFLFGESIRDNLAVGLDDGVEGGVRDRRVQHAAEVAQLAETVAALPAGFDTLLGERGINLSGGQKQRAAIARAIARDPRVLVLDDALSAVDTQTERRILGGLARVFQGRTALVVSHRLSAISVAEQVVVLAGGRVVEQGTHGELLASGGAFAVLLRRQRLQEDLQEAEALAPFGGKE